MRYTIHTTHLTEAYSDGFIYTINPVIVIKRPMKYWAAAFLDQVIGKINK